MGNQATFHKYTSNGKTLPEQGIELEPFTELESINDPAGYLADDRLCYAVNVALELGAPLLLTGEPGCGKTQLAASVAHKLGLANPLIFNAKSTSTARDLFYRYDSLRHFQDIQLEKARGFSEMTVDINNYIEYGALGQAVLLSKADEFAKFLPNSLKERRPSRSVVLIDEIDKAPRDLPNDVLNEIELMEFRVPEINQIFKAAPAYRPIIIMTSNSEKNLPDAFLRRCIFCHIEFPKGEQLRQIVTSRIREWSSFTPEMLDAAIAKFEEIRKLALKKKPATAELLAWIRVLDQLGHDLSKPGAAEAIALTYVVLAKNSDDLSELIKSQKI